MPDEPTAQRPKRRLFGRRREAVERQPEGEAPAASADDLSAHADTESAEHPGGADVAGQAQHTDESLEEGSPLVAQSAEPSADSADAAPEHSAEPDPTGTDAAGPDGGVEQGPAVEPVVTEAADSVPPGSGISEPDHAEPEAEAPDGSARGDSEPQARARIDSARGDSEAETEVPVASAGDESEPGYGVSLGLARSDSEPEGEARIESAGADSQPDAGAPSDSARDGSAPDNAARDDAAAHAPVTAAEPAAETETQTTTSTPTSATAATAEVAAVERRPEPEEQPDEEPDAAMTADAGRQQPTPAPATEAQAEATEGPPAAVPAVALEAVDAIVDTDASPDGPLPTPRVIAIANQKGGVGKTTTAVNLGAALAEVGFRVLVVDLDPQGNASTGLGINPRDVENSIYDVIMTDAPALDCVEPTSLKNLFVLPATIDLAGAEIELVAAFSRELKLRRALDTVRSEYDVILIDCPPSLGLLTVTGLAAADDVSVPVQSEYYALEGLGQLLKNVAMVRSLNPTLDVRGIVLTMHDSRTKLAEQVESEVRGHFGTKVYRTVVPRTVRLSEAPSFGQPIIVFDPTSRGAQAYRDLADEVSSGASKRPR